MANIPSHMRLQEQMAVVRNYRRRREDRVLGSMAALAGMGATIGLMTAVAVLLSGLIR